jgi:hypothetical protein
MIEAASPMLIPTLLADLKADRKLGDLQLSNRTF